MKKCEARRDPLSVPCPLCGKPPGVQCCWYPSGDAPSGKNAKRGKPHALRVEAASAPSPPLMEML